MTSVAAFNSKVFQMVAFGKIFKMLVQKWKCPLESFQ